MKNYFFKITLLTLPMLVALLLFPARAVSEDVSGRVTGWNYYNFGWGEFDTIYEGNLPLKVKLLEFTRNDAFEETEIEVAIREDGQYSLSVVGGATDEFRVQIFPNPPRGYTVNPRYGYPENTNSGFSTSTIPANADFKLIPYRSSQDGHSGLSLIKGRAVYDSSPGTLTTIGNIVWNNSAWVESNIQGSNLSELTDPKFVGATDFHIQHSSPASMKMKLESGQDIPLYDLAGGVRGGSSSEDRVRWDSTSYGAFEDTSSVCKVFRTVSGQVSGIGYYNSIPIHYEIGISRGQKLEGVVYSGLGGKYEILVRDSSSVKLMVEPVQGYTVASQTSFSLEKVSGNIENKNFVFSAYLSSPDGPAGLSLLKRRGVASVTDRTSSLTTINNIVWNNKGWIKSDIEPRANLKELTNPKFKSSTDFHLDSLSPAAMVVPLNSVWPWGASSDMAGTRRGGGKSVETTCDSTSWGAFETKAWMCSNVAVSGQVFGVGYYNQVPVHYDDGQLGTVLTDFDGHYTIRGIFPGNGKVKIWVDSLARGYTADVSSFRDTVSNGKKIPPFSYSTYITSKDGPSDLPLIKGHGVYNPDAASLVTRSNIVWNNRGWIASDIVTANNVDFPETKDPKFRSATDFQLDTLPKSPAYMAAKDTTFPLYCDLRGARRGGGMTCDTISYGAFEGDDTCTTYIVRGTVRLDSTGHINDIKTFVTNGRTEVVFNRDTASREHNYTITVLKGASVPQLKIFMDDSAYSFRREDYPYDDDNTARDTIIINAERFELDFVTDNTLDSQDFRGRAWRTVKGVLSAVDIEDVRNQLMDGMYVQYVHTSNSGDRNTDSLLVNLNDMSFTIKDTIHGEKLELRFAGSIPSYGHCPPREFSFDPLCGDTVVGFYFLHDPLKLTGKLSMQGSTSFEGKKVKYTVYRHILGDTLLLQDTFVLTDASGNYEITDTVFGRDVKICADSVFSEYTYPAPEWKSQLSGDINNINFEYRHPRLVIEGNLSELYKGNLIPMALPYYGVSYVKFSAKNNSTLDLVVDSVPVDSAGNYKIILADTLYGSEVSVSVDTMPRYKGPDTTYRFDEVRVSCRECELEKNYASGIDFKFVHTGWLRITGKAIGLDAEMGVFVNYAVREEGGFPLFNRNVQVSADGTFEIFDTLYLKGIVNLTAAPVDGYEELEPFIFTKLRRDTVVDFLYTHLLKLSGIGLTEENEGDTLIPPFRDDVYDYTLVLGCKSLIEKPKLKIPAYSVTDEVTVIKGEGPDATIVGYKDTLVPIDWNERYTLSISVERKNTEENTSRTYIIKVAAPYDSTLVLRSAYGNMMEVVNNETFVKTKNTSGYDGSAGNKLFSKFLWYIGDDSIAGATKSVYYQAGGLREGAYKVKVWYADEEDGYGSWVCNANVPASVSGSKNILKTYPNPVTSQLKVYYNSLEPGVAIKIFDLSGTLIDARVSTGEETTFDNLSHLSQGAYVVRVKNESAVVIKK